MENNEKEMEIITTEEDIYESDPENNENKKYDEARIYYVYEHIRLDKMEPFYIGKGKGERAYELYRNDHHDAITDEYGHAVVIIADNLTEEEAYWLERDTIEDYVFNLGNGIDIKGHNDYDHALPHLTNMDWGGIGGKSGVKHSEEYNKKISESLKGENHPMYGKHHSEETKQKMSKNHADVSGKKNPMWGKTSPNKGKKGLFHHSEESKRKMSKNNSSGKRKVICTTTGENFDCIKDAVEKYNIYSTSISKCCNGKYKTAGELNGVPLQWKYLEDDDNDLKAI